MNTIKHNLQAFRHELGDRITLVAVSKNHPVEAVLEAYRAGQRIFGENRVQEMVTKQPILPTDIQWHLIGHLQTNKVKYIAPFVSMIQSIDSLKLLTEVSIQALKNGRVIDCLLQMYIASEDTKFGLDESEAIDLLTNLRQSPLPGVRIRGLMGMATFTDDQELVRREFYKLRLLMDQLKAGFFQEDDSFVQLSMGMSGDYGIAIEEGSTIVRIGTKIFGIR